MQRDAEKGIIFADQDKCRGCWMCVMACPFGAVIPSAGYKVAIKCDACMHMEEPACVASCPTGALVYGDEDTYGKVLTARRGRIAVMAASVQNPQESSIISIELIREDK
jgi:carbon-monoxide dehydrogenase iron sulfur subunit